MATNGESKNIQLKELLKVTHARTWNEAVVKLGYADFFGLDNHFFDFTVRLSSPEEIERIISLIDSYNNFEGEPLAQVLSGLVTNGTLMYIEFGRAGSPELFVYMKNPEVNRPAMMEMLKAFSPDELDEAGPWAIRAWWD